MKRILCALCISLVGWQALAGEVEDNLKKLEAAFEKEPKEQEKTSAGNECPEFHKPNLKTQLFSLREKIKTDRISGAIGTLESLKNETLSEDIRKDIDELIGTLRNDLDARIKKTLAPFERARNHATDAVKNAKTAADLDAVLQELANVKSLPDSQVSDVSVRNGGRVEHDYSFVAKWQEYLAAKAGGYDEEARSIAKDLVKLPTLLLPRSEILAKAYEPKTAGDKTGEKATPPAPQPTPAK